MAPESYADKSRWKALPPLLVVLGLAVVRFLGPLFSPDFSRNQDLLTLGVLTSALALFIIRNRPATFQWSRRADFPKGRFGGVILAGVLVLFLPPALDLLIETSALAAHPLFRGAQGRVLEALPMSSRSFLQQVILVPFLCQAFLTGYLLPPLAPQMTLGRWLALSAVLFPLTVWKFTLGWAVLGLGSALLFRWTRTWSAPWVFHMCCAFAGWQITYLHPRVVTFLGFLF